LLVEANDKQIACHIAAEGGHVRTLQKLWESDENGEINAKNVLLLAKDMQEKTALHIAADNGQLDTVKFLVEKGADVHAKTDIGETL
jgi:ankyrin repeat protein